MVGSALVRAIKRSSPEFELILAERKKLDLLDQMQFASSLEKKSRILLSMLLQRLVEYMQITLFQLSLSIKIFLLMLILFTLLGKMVLSVF